MATVTFVNAAKNATSYLWNFGDGSSSTQAAPTHVFSSPGCYIVRLTATGPGGAVVSEKPVAVQTGEIATFLADSNLDQLTDNSGNEIVVNT